MSPSGILGIVTNDPNDVFQKAVISGVKSVATQNAYDVVTHTYTFDPNQADTKRADKLPFNLSSVSGVLVIANALPDQLLKTIYRDGKPISLVSHQVTDTAIPVVMSNNVQGIAELVKHLVVRCRRRNLVFVRGIMNQNDALEREATFRQEIIRYKLHIPESAYLQGDFSYDTAAKSIRNYVKQGGKVDGIIAADYVMAIAAMDELRRQGYAVPKDVSVVGFGDNPEAEVAGLTTAAASITELGSCAARQLISQIKGLRISGTTILSVRLIIRQSCGYQPPE